MKPHPEHGSSDRGLHERKVYKVVAASSRSSSAPVKMAVSYLPGEFVKAPEGTKLFAFDSLEHARRFQRLGGDLSVWEATGRGVSQADRRVAKIGFKEEPGFDEIEIKDFWQAKRHGERYGFLSGIRSPGGTVWADAIRLDKRL